MEAEHYSCAGQPSLPELCHFGFRKWGLGRSYIFIRYIRGSLNRATGLLWDLLLPIYRGHLHWQVATQITSMSKWSPRVLVSMFACYTHLSAGAAAGGAGLLGVVGDGCSCFSMVNLTSSCSKNISTDNVRIMEGHKKTLSILSPGPTFTPSSTALMTLVTDATFSLSSKSMPSSITWSAQRIRLARLW